MKLSQFNVVVKNGSSTFIYNTLSSGVLRLDKNYAEAFDKLSIDEVTDSSKKDLIENLIKGNMLIDDDVIEIDNLKVLHNKAKYASQGYSLTIAPTMKCNFVCPYCYEKGRNLHTMDSNTINNTKEFIKGIKDITPTLLIAWYGGEPLLAMDIIEDISQYALDLYGENYSAVMVTNGYNLSVENAKKLKDFKVNNIQITIDGPPDIHNKMRKLPNGHDTFFVILNNIRNVFSVYPELEVVIRVNTDKTNIQRVDEILDYLKEYDLKGKVSVYLAPIDNINDTCEVAENCFSNVEFAKEQLNYIQRNFERGYNFVKLPDPNIPICGAVSANSAVIDALGDIYKCWDDVSNAERRAGNVKDGFKLNPNFTDWMLYDPFNDRECVECAYLPICMGGCPNQVLKKNQRKCTPMKENSAEMIRLLYELSKQKKND